jgi:hypothetical protein
MSTTRYELDAGAERSTARLRQAAALVVGGAGSWLALAQGTLAAGAVGALALLAGVAWWGRARGQKRRAAHASATALVLDDNGFELTSSAKPTIRVLWGEVEAIQVDEERLGVVVQRRNAPTVTVEPVYRGLSLYDLEVILAEHRRRAFSRAVGAADD